VAPPDLRGNSAADGEGEEKDDKKSKKAKTEKKAAKPKKADTHQLNANKAVDKKHEGKSFTDIVKLPPSALQGLSEDADAMFAKYNIKTIAQLASWKFYNAAVAIVELSKLEEKGKRETASQANISKLVDKAYEKSSLKELAKGSLSVFKGLSEAADNHFTIQGFTVRTISELAKNKFPKIAQGLVTLSEFEGEGPAAAASS